MVVRCEEVAEPVKLADAREEVALKRPERDTIIVINAELLSNDEALELFTALSKTHNVAIEPFDVILPLFCESHIDGSQLIHVITPEASSKLI